MTPRCYICDKPIVNGGYFVADVSPKGLKREIYVCRDCYKTHKQEVKE